ncbi:MAG: o-succinylbenzoate--CoA ligase [Ktedonobacteraceae bacterium]
MYTSDTLDTLDTLLPDWLTRCAQNRPKFLAIQYGETQWSFAQLDHEVSRLARQLATLHVSEGSRVALLAANSFHFVTCVHALTRLGAILIPLNTRLTLDELRWQVQDAHVTLLLCDAEHASLATHITEDISQIAQATFTPIETYGTIPVLGSLPETNVPLRTLIDLQATQAIMYTSGTTGTPKGAIVTYGMQWWNAIGSALNLGHQADDCWLACMPFFHIGGLSILMRSVIYQISVVVQQKFDPFAVNQAIQKQHVTIVSVVAVMLQRMLAALDAQQDAYPSTLHCVLLGGGPAPLPLLEACAAKHIPVVQTYGMTEACSQAVTLAHTDALRKLGSAGRPLPPVQLRIMLHEREARTGEAGEIYLKGPTITPGYADRPDATAQAFHDGWLATGDIGYLDEEGYLYVLDRRSDLIISGGENVYPAEIEAVLLSHPDVSEAGVCGQADAQWGQVPIAFVHLKNGSITSTEELMEYTVQHLARYKQPRTLHIVEQLPRNSSGKLLRRELTKLLSLTRVNS